MTAAAHNPEPFKVLDLFAGCGGLTEGFHQYRPGASQRPVFRSVGAVEWEASAAASYAANFGTSASQLTDFDPPEIYCRSIVGWEPKWAPGEVDVVVGGPPCQGFSGLNRNNVRPERNTLWEEFIRVVARLQPKVFVIENVDRFLRSAEFEDLKDRVGSDGLKNYKLVDPNGIQSGTERGQNSGYLLNAANYGAAQARRRAIVIGVRTDSGPPSLQFRYPTPTHSRDAVQSRSDSPRAGSAFVHRKRWETVDDLFAASADLEISKDLPSTPSMQIDGVPGMWAGPYLTTDLHVGRQPQAISLSRYQAIPESGNRNDLRGRYACRFGVDEELILEKVGASRNADGTLRVLGQHSIVVHGIRSELQVTVRSITQSGPAELRAGQSHDSRLIQVLIDDGRTKRPATLEYLSTSSWDSHVTGSGDVMGRLRYGRPSVTVRTEFFKPEKGRYLHPTEHRPITHFEAAKLQGFPDKFKWHGSKVEIARQIGNAVPVPLGRKIAESIYVYLSQLAP